MSELVCEFAESGFDTHPEGSGNEGPYTVPAFISPEGSYLLDTGAIAAKLQSLRPSPSIHLNTELEKQANSANREVFLPLAPYFAPYTTTNVVASEDEEWYKADRAPKFGMSVDELMAEKDADAAYAEAKPGFDKIRALLKEHKTDRGPFILGSMPCYADFILVATSRMFILFSAELFERFLEEAGPEFADLYHACGKWMMKQD